GVWRETGLATAFGPEGPPVRWRIPVHQGYAGPAVVGDALYVMDFIKDPVVPESTKPNPGSGDRPKFPPILGVERVLCIDPATGKERWRHEAKRDYRISYPEGPRTTPNVDGDLVFALGAMGDLICFDRHTGRVVWEKNLPTTYNTEPPVWGYAAHPLLDGEHLICSAGGKGSAIVALEKQTGREVWRSITAKEIGYAPPVIIERGGKRQLIYWYDAAVAGLDPSTGKRVWDVKFPLVPSGQVSVTIAQPAFADPYLLISEFYAGSMLLKLADDLSDAEPVWNSEPGETEHPDGLNALMTPPFIREGHIFGISGDGEFRCLELLTGKLVWRDEKLTDKKPREYFGTAFWVRNGDRYFVFNDQGYLQIASITPEGCQELSSTKLLETTGAARGRTYVWSPPAFAQGCMFARNDKELICVDLRKS
ncbi:MAG TPA: PQQ-binding-like beta-propeller repeat protein, partial [Pirellulaceae bacterium]